LTRYCAIVEYDGTDFVGFQIQAKGRTVQGEIEQTLRRVTQFEIRIDGAGRTDAGVHAVGQVIAFSVDWNHALEDLHCALNATLPQDIVVSRLTIVPHEFHPRFDALSRCYCYTISNQIWPSVLQRRYVYHVRDSLDLVAMQKATQFLVGCYDFASFGKPTQGTSTVREVMQADWKRAGNQLFFWIRANAFLYRMVRRIVGTLVQVGLGRLQPQDIQHILEVRNLKYSAPPAPACGLCLVEVTYPE